MYTFLHVLFPLLTLIFNFSVLKKMSIYFRNPTSNQVTVPTKMPLFHVIFPKDTFSLNFLLQYSQSYEIHSVVPDHFPIPIFSSGNLFLYFSVLIVFSNNKVYFSFVLFFNTRFSSLKPNFS